MVAAAQSQLIAKRSCACDRAYMRACMLAFVRACVSHFYKELSMRIYESELI